MRAALLQKALQHQCLCRLAADQDQVLQEPGPSRALVCFCSLTPVGHLFITAKCAHKPAERAHLSALLIELAFPAVARVQPGARVAPVSGARKSTTTRGHSLQVEVLLVRKWKTNEGSGGARELIIFFLHFLLRSSRGMLDRSFSLSRLVSQSHFRLEGPSSKPTV